MAKFNQCYGLGQGTINTMPVPLHFENAPTSSQTNYVIGQEVYVGTPGNYTFYIYAGAGVWVELTSPSGNVTSVTGTTNQIAVSPTTGATVVSLPAAITAPGSLTTTTTLTGGTGIIATTGNITATNGNDRDWETTVAPVVGLTAI